MMYKTIVHELLQQYPAMHERLRMSRQLLPTMEALARELKTRHEYWQSRLAQSKPRSNQHLIASQAAELALKELEDRLYSAAQPDEAEPMSLDAAMAFLRDHTPPA